MKISLCCTIKNEESSIGYFLNSIFNQTRIPDEMIIVDGGSTDRTIKILNEYQHKFPDIIKIIISDGANIAKGRNISIKNAKYIYIASADAGTEYDKNWLKNLSDYFEVDPEIDVVSGYFEPKAENLFEEVIGVLLFPNPELMNWERFLPSARSVAFKKEVWEELNGYAEWLPKGIGEDSHFALCAMENGYNFAHAKNAICYWQPRSNLRGLFKQYFYYSQGAAFGGFEGVFLLEAYGGSAIKTTIKNLTYFAKNKKIKHIAMSFLVLTIVLLGKILGTISGIIKRSINK